MFGDSGDRGESEAGHNFTVRGGVAVFLGEILDEV